MPLRDLEQIQQDVVDDRTSALLADVVRCYEGGAYRAALVSLWIAVVADLTSKIRYLAESGDGEARSVIDNLDKAFENQTVSRVQEYERNILTTAEQHLGILLPRERRELERLNEDRNLCAHPGYVGEAELFVPDAEVVRAHLVAANRAVFSQRPLAGKRLLATLEVELKGESWPSGGEYFLSRFFRPARDSVKTNMVKVLIKHSVRPPDGSNRVARRSLNAALVIANDSPSLFEGGLSSVLNTWEASGSLGDSKLVRAVGSYGSRTVLWSALPDTGKSRLTALLKGCDVDALIDDRFFVSGVPSDADVAEQFLEIVSRLDSAQMKKAIRQSKNRSLFVRPAINRVGSSESFRGAEENLRLVELCSANLEPEDVIALREAIQGNLRNQVRLAGDTEAILSSIYSESSPNDVARGEWRGLAEWLHAQGVENGDDYYLYNDFLELVGTHE